MYSEATEFRLKSSSCQLVFAITAFDLLYWVSSEQRLVGRSQIQSKDVLVNCRLIGPLSINADQIG